MTGRASFIHSHEQFIRVLHTSLHKHGDNRKALKGNQIMVLTEKCVRRIFKFRLLRFFQTRGLRKAVKAQ